MQELWIGKRFLRDIRECKFVNLETGEINYLLMSEEEIERNISIVEPTLKIKRTDDYEEVR